MNMGNTLRPGDEEHLSGPLKGHQPVAGLAPLCNDLFMSQSGKAENPWWNAAQDHEQEEPLPPVVVLAPDYHAGDNAGLPLWSEESGQIPWESTKFSPELLDRLAAWQQEFESSFHWEKGWRSERAQAQWASEAHELTADIRRELSTRSMLTVDLWPLNDTKDARGHDGSG